MRHYRYRLRLRQVGWHRCGIIPGQITDTQMKCGSLTNVQFTNYGVELAAGGNGKYVDQRRPRREGLPRAHRNSLMHVDTLPLDPSVSICNNSRRHDRVLRMTSFCGTRRREPYQPAPRTFSMVATVAGFLYAVPFKTPIGGEPSRRSNSTPPR